MEKNFFSSKIQEEKDFASHSEHSESNTATQNVANESETTLIEDEDVQDDIGNGSHNTGPKFMTLAEIESSSEQEDVTNNSSHESEHSQIIQSVSTETHSIVSSISETTTRLTEESTEIVTIIENVANRLKKSEENLEIQFQQMDEQLQRERADLISQVDHLTSTGTSLRQERDDQTAEIAKLTDFVGEFQFLEENLKNQIKDLAERNSSLNDQNSSQRGEFETQWNNLSDELRTVQEENAKLRNEFVSESQFRTEEFVSASQFRTDERLSNSQFRTEGQEEEFFFKLQEVEGCLAAAEDSTADLEMELSDERKAKSELVELIKILENENADLARGMKAAADECTNVDDQRKQLFVQLSEAKLLLSELETKNDREKENFTSQIKELETKNDRELNETKLQLSELETKIESDSLRMNELEKELEALRELEKEMETVRLENFSLRDDLTVQTEERSAKQDELKKLKQITAMQLEEITKERDDLAVQVETEKASVEILTKEKASFEIAARKSRAEIETARENLVILRSEREKVSEKLEFFSQKEIFVAVVEERACSPIADFAEEENLKKISLEELEEKFLNREIEFQKLMDAAEKEKSVLAEEIRLLRKKFSSLDAAVVEKLSEFQKLVDAAGEEKSSLLEEKNIFLEKNSFLEASLQQTNTQAKEEKLDLTKQVLDLEKFVQKSQIESDKLQTSLDQSILENSSLTERISQLMEDEERFVTEKIKLQTVVESLTEEKFCLSSRIAQIAASTSNTKAHFVLEMEKIKNSMNSNLVSLRAEFQSKLKEQDVEEKRHLAEKDAEIKNLTAALSTLEDDSKKTNLLLAETISERENLLLDETISERDNLLLREKILQENEKFHAEKISSIGIFFRKNLESIKSAKNRLSVELGNLSKQQQISEEKFANQISEISERFFASEKLNANSQNRLNSVLAEMENKQRHTETVLLEEKAERDHLVSRSESLMLALKAAENELREMEEKFEETATANAMKLAEMASFANSQEEVFKMELQELRSRLVDFESIKIQLMEEIQFEKDEFSKQFSEISSRLSFSENANDNFQARISELFLENDAFSKKFQDKNAFLENVEKEIKFLIEKREEFQRKNKDLSNRLDSSEQLKNDTMNQMALLTVQNSRERDEAVSLIADLSKKLKISETKISEFEIQIEFLTKKREKDDVICAEMTQKVSKLTEEINLKQQEFSVSEQERNSLQEKLGHVTNSLQEKLGHVTDQLIEAETQKMEFENEKKDWEKQRTQLVSQIEELQKGLLETKKTTKDSGHLSRDQLTTAFAEIRQLIDQLATAKLDCAGWEMEVRDANQRIDFFVKENENLKIELANFIERMDVAQREKSDLEQRLKQLVFDQNFHVAEQERLLAEARSSQAHFEMRVKDLVTQNAEMISRVVGSNEKTNSAERKYLEALQEISNVEKERDESRLETAILNRKLSDLVVSEADLKERLFRISEKIQTGMQSAEMVSFGKVRSLVTKNDKNDLEFCQENSAKMNLSENVTFSTPSRSVCPTPGHVGKSSSLISLTVNKSHDSPSIGMDLVKSSPDDCTDGLGNDVIEQYQYQVSAEKKKRRELEYQLNVMSQNCKMAADTNQQWQEAFAVLDRTYEWKSDQSQSQSPLIRNQSKKRQNISRSRSFQTGQEMDVMKDDKPTQTELLIPQSSSVAVDLDGSLQSKVADVCDGLSRLRMANQDLRKLVSEQTSSADVFRLLWIAVSEASEDYKKMQKNLEDMIQLIGNEPSGIEKKALVSKRVIRDKDCAVAVLRVSVDDKSGSSGLGRTYRTHYRQSSQDQRTTRRSAPFSSAARTRV